MGLNAFGDAVELVDAGPQRTRDHLQKAPRARRAFIIHQKIGEITRVVQLDNLAVLAADIDDRPGLRGQQPRAEPVARDLGDLLIGKIHQLATVAG